MKKLILFIIILLGISTLAQAQTTYKSWRQRTHATDCTAITDGKTADLCYEQDSQNIYICDAVDGTCNTAGEWKLSSSSGSGVGDVTSVGDCTSGACNDGSNDGGTYIRLYDGDSNYGQFQTANLSADRTYTYPNETGTICTTGSVCSGYQSTLTTGTLSATSPVTVSGARTVIGGAAVIAIANSAADGTTKGAAAFTAADFDAASGVVSLDYTNAQAASSGSKGFLTSADWTTFNAKLSSASIDTSSELATILTDETGSGALVFANTPTLVTPVLGAATATSLTVNTGNVGIGTTSSDATLELVKQSTDEYLMLSSSGSANGDVLIINSAGNVGIGSTLPGNKLVVNGSIQAGVGTTGTMQASSLLILSANDGTTSHVVITSGGNVGIGSTAPSQKLSVNGTIESISGGIKYPDGTTQTTAASGAGWTDGGTTVYLTTSTDNVGVGTTAASVKLDVRGAISASGSGDSYMNVSSGNLGVGTAAPRAKLDVEGGLKVTGGIATALTGSRCVETDSSGNLTVASSACGTATGWTDGGTTIYPTTTTDAVGIGTTVASGSLEVVKISSQAPLMVSATASGDGDLLIVGSAGNVGIGTTTALNNKLTVNGAIGMLGTGDTYLNANSGNVGVGTSAPSSLLDVDDAGYLQFRKTSAGAPTAGDCDSDAERGRLSIDTTNNRLYICNGASRAWDYVGLTD